MSYFSINGTIGFFDLNNYVIDKNIDKDDIIFKQKPLQHGIRLTVYNNFYYIFDFSNSDFARPSVKFNTSEEIRGAQNSVDIYLQKEVINVFNLCLYRQIRVRQPNNHLSSKIKRLDFVNIDQFFIPNNISDNVLTMYDYLNCGTDFSTEMYKKACNFMRSTEPSESIGKDLIDDSIELLNKILDDKQIINFDEEYHKSLFYIISHIGKAIYYAAHDLRVDSAIYLRATYEALIRRIYNIEGDIKKYHKRFFDDTYDRLVEIDKIYTENINKEELSSFFEDFAKNLRHPAAHSLKIPEKTVDLELCLNYLTKFLNLYSGINLMGILR